MTWMKQAITSAIAAALGLGSVGCATHTGTDALIGGVGGALAGAAIGSHSHSRAGEGALLGGAIGAIGGAIVGNEADRQEREGRYYDDYDRGGYARAGSYYDDDYYVRYETRTYSPRYRSYDDCRPARYGYRGYRSYRGYGHGPRHYR
jgi:uncharacterized protein YcfJ